METQNYWKKCSTCKKEIGFNQAYQVCSVSTCRSKRTGLTFCSVPCWDAHLGFANHRSSYAEEHRSPTREAFLQELNVTQESRPAQNKEPSPRRRIIARPETSSSGTKPDLKNIKTDTLVVVSKVKQLIRDQSGFNTSQCAIDALTQKVIEECLRAIDHAKTAERKTVMGRDII